MVFGAVLVPLVAPRPSPRRPSNREGVVVVAPSAVSRPQPHLRGSGWGGAVAIDPAGGAVMRMAGREGLPTGLQVAGRVEGLQRDDPHTRQRCGEGVHVVLE